MAATLACTFSEYCIRLSLALSMGLWQSSCMYSARRGFDITCFDFISKKSWLSMKVLAMGDLFYISVWWI